MKKLFVLFLTLFCVAMLASCSQRIVTESIVSFETNGGSAVADKENEVTTIPVPKKTGYRLEGWYADESLTKRVSFPYVATESIKLYAKWTSLATGSPELRYERTEDGNALIVKSYDLESYAVVVPDNYYGTPVVGIKAGFLKTRAYVNVLFIGKNVSFIDEEFYRCVQLKRFEIDGENPTFQEKDGALYKKTTDEIVAFPRAYDASTLTVDCKLAKNAVRYNTNLRSVTLGEHADAPYLAFTDLPNLQEFVVSENNGSFYAEDGILFSKNKKSLYVYPRGKTEKEYVVPDFVEIVENGAFSDCAVTKITLGAGVTRYDDYTDAPRLTAFAVKRGNERFAAVDGALYDADCKVLYRYPTGKQGACEVADGTEEIYPLAFAYASLTTAITLPESVQKIGSFAFRDCSSLVSVTCKAESRLSTIGGGAFARCENLETVVLTSRRPPEIEAHEFDGKKIGFAVIVPENAGEAYAYYWNEDGGVLRPTGLALPEYTVTFETRGGSVVQAYHGVFLSRAPLTIREGYTFGGWFTDEDYLGFPVGFPYLIEDHVTLYADWRY